MTPKSAHGVIPDAKLHPRRLITRGHFETMSDMIEHAEAIEQSGEGILRFEVSDEALEAAASQTQVGAAMSFPNAPTVSILVMCCSNG